MPSGGILLGLGKQPRSRMDLLNRRESTGFVACDFEVTVFFYYELAGRRQQMTPTATILNLAHPHHGSSW